MFCTNCGTDNAESNQVCSRCGAPIGKARATILHEHSSAQPYVGPTQTCGKAVASLICGILAFIFPVAVAAVILGHMSHSEIRKAAGRLTGRGMATAGLILGYLGIALIPFILIVAAIAIPNLLRAKTAANEASAVGSLRTVVTAAVTYQSTYENGYPSTLDALGGDEKSMDCNHAALIDSELASGEKNGYVISYAPIYPNHGPGPVISPAAASLGCTSGGASGFQITADPIKAGTTGTRHFFVDQTGVFRYSTRNSATASSPALE